MMTICPVGCLNEHVTPLHLHFFLNGKIKKLYGSVSLSIFYYYVLYVWYIILNPRRRTTHGVQVHYLSRIFCHNLIFPFLFLLNTFKVTWDPHHPGRSSAGTLFASSPQAHTQCCFHCLLAIHSFIHLLLGLKDYYVKKLVADWQISISFSLASFIFWSCLNNVCVCVE